MALNLREIVAISGRSGLYRVVSPARNGILVESLDASKARTLVPAQAQVSSLGDISMYTTTEEGTVALADVLQSIRQQYGPQVAVTAKSDPQTLVTFIRSVVPDYDADRVYLSDIKKLVTWYNVLGPHLPESAAAAADTAAAAAPSAAAPDAPTLSTGGEVPAQTPDSSDGTPVVQ